MGFRYAALLLIVIGSTLGIVAAPTRAQVHDPRALAADPETAVGPIAPRLAGLGDDAFPVTTRSAESQQFVDQGLRLTYAFNHSEALRAFKEAARLDPENAMAYWGWALVLGPNLNLPMQPAVAPQARHAAQRALELASKVSPREKAYIDAIAQRYAGDAATDRRSLDEAYARAMKRVLDRHPDDLDAATLYAAALVNLSPWNYWNLDGTPRPHTDEIVAILESVLQRNPQHVGALHYLIHLFEDRFPARAESHADALRPLMPGAGHIVHMPSHIYMRVGRYSDSYAVNALAAEADEGYIIQCRAQGVYPLNYYPHNVHFLAWSAMFLGRPDLALAAARKIVQKVPTDLASDGNVWALYEVFLAQPIFVMVRFGMWEAMLAETKPSVDSQFITGIWHYGRALAFLHSGRPAKARQELDWLAQRRQAMGELGRYVSATSGEKLLTIAEEIVRGELAAREGHTLEGLARLERAVRLEDGLAYNAPPEWYFPVRHWLGAMLLDVGRPDEAEVVYAADLRSNPENAYALLGLKLALEQQGKTEDAQSAARRFARAWSGATHELQSSRY